MTQQPEWKCVAQIGDATPLEYGGFWVFVDKTGVYPPEAECYEPDEGVASRIILEDCTYIDGVLSDNKFHPEHPVWFADKITELAEFSGLDVTDLIGLFTSGDPVDRAIAWRVVGEYFGWFELDQYPLLLSKAEAEERYGEQRFVVGGKEKADDRQGDCRE